jgi:hypothetical protein
MIYPGLSPTPRTFETHQIRNPKTAGSKTDRVPKQQHSNGGGGGGGIKLHDVSLQFNFSNDFSKQNKVFNSESTFGRLMFRLSKLAKTIYKIKTQGGTCFFSFQYNVTKVTATWEKMNDKIQR